MGNTCPGATEVTQPDPPEVTRWLHRCCENEGAGTYLCLVAWDR